MQILDISMEINEDMATYPGNPRPEIQQYRQLPDDSTTESRICLGSHTGTHVDAPRHVEEGGRTVADIELERFYGQAQVLDLAHCTENVDSDDLAGHQIREQIVLLKTDNTHHGYTSFREDFTYLTRDGVEHLIERDVGTIGIDYLSLVEFEGGTDAAAAHRRANEEMVVIEGLDLRGIDAGTYRFAGFPLRTATDGSPMRACLIRD